MSFLLPVQGQMQCSYSINCIWFLTLRLFVSELLITSDKHLQNVIKSAFIQSEYLELSDKCLL